MIQLTPEEFHKVREGVAGAHLLIQAIKPILKQRRTPMNKDLRNLLEIVPDTVGTAFVIISQVTQREAKAPSMPGEKPTANVGDIDTKVFMTEIENVSALYFPDLEDLMLKALEQLPLLNEGLSSSMAEGECAAKEMAWAWEAGRRYGVLQAIAVCDSTVQDFANGTTTALDAVLNSTMELPPPELPLQPAEIVPFEYPSADAATNSDARSRVALAAAEIEAFNTGKKLNKSLPPALSALLDDDHDSSTGE